MTETVDFSHLKKLDVSPGKTSEYILHQLENSPVLLVAPANEANKSYFNAVLRRSRKNLRALRQQVVSESMIRENRDEDRELFAQHVLKGWRGVQDTEGSDVPFNRENALAFLNALPNWIFDDLRNFAGDPLGFVEESEFGVMEAAETGKS